MLHYIFLIGGFYSERYEQLVNKADWDILIIGLLVTILFFYGVAMKRNTRIYREKKRHGNPARDSEFELTRDHWNSDM